MKRLAPYGRRFLESPADPVLIIQGPRSFNIAENLGFISALAVPPNESANDFRWPVRDRECWLIEFREIDDERVEETATALLNAGATVVNVSRLDLLGVAFTYRFLPEYESCPAA